MVIKMPDFLKSVADIEKESNHNGCKVSPWEAMADETGGRAVRNKSFPL